MSIKSSNLACNMMKFLCQTNSIKKNLKRLQTLFQERIYYRHQYFDVESILPLTYTGCHILLQL